MTGRRLATGCYGAAALLTLGAFVCPPLLDRHDDARADALAEAGLQRLAEGERALFAAQGKFAGFGPSDADRAAALPQVHLGPEFDDLNFDALPDSRGTLQLRATSRAEAVRTGRLPPLIKMVRLVDQAKDLSK